MRTLKGRRSWVVGVAAALLTAACGAGDDTGPDSRPIIAKATTKSGDVQTGLVNEPLPDDLRVVITRDGAPVPDITVAWSTSSGSLDPVSGETDADGVSTSTWTLGDAPGQVTATAAVPDASGSPVTFTATAVQDDGPVGTTVQVLGPEGGNRFEPSALTVTTGTTVSWVWGENAQSHNVIPDDNVTPAASGPLASAPHEYQFTFGVPGTYHYHCELHGGSGMTGTITVVDIQP